tara:strand:+ start:647 stop:1570 length:924 start_codon:yes stop_codon:yes gene_type:complete
MKLICTTVVRAAEQGQTHGGLYVIDVESGEIIYHKPLGSDFVNYNERGGERGLRGIAVLDDRIIVAGATGLMELNRDTYEIVKKTENPEAFQSIHEICVHEDSIWVTSTGRNCIVKTDLDFNVENIWEYQAEYFDDYQKIVSSKLVTGNQASCNSTSSCMNKKTDENHINSISAFNGRVVFSAALSDLYDVETLEQVAPRTCGGFTHNFYEYPDMIISNKTTLRHLKIVRQEEEVLIPIPVCREKTVGVDKIAENNWNRGLARREGLLFIGSSPARILIFDLETFRYTKEIVLESDVRHCIHGLELL